MQKIIEEIKKHKKIIIHRHISPDGDALGSQFALKEWIDINFPKKKLYCVGDHYSNYLNNLFLEKPDELTKKDYEDSLVIVLDTANKDRISGKFWKNSKNIIKIDHHIEIEKYGNLKLIEEKASSTCEVLAKMFFENNQYKVSDKCARFLYIGILTDTNRFLYSSKEDSSLLIADKLIKYNIKTNEIFSSLYEKNEKQVKFNSYISRKYKLKDGISYLILKKNVYKKYGLEYKNISSLVYLLTQSKEAKYSFYCTWNKEFKNYKCSLRSKDKRIDKVANKFNGGGHEKASGFNIKKKSNYKDVLKEIKILKDEQ